MLNIPTEQYVICTAALPSVLEQIVAGYIQERYYPLGGISVAYENGAAVFAQAMIHQDCLGLD